MLGASWGLSSPTTLPSYSKGAWNGANFIISPTLSKRPHQKWAPELGTGGSEGQLALGSQGTSHLLPAASRGSSSQHLVLGSASHHIRILPLRPCWTSNPASSQHSNHGGTFPDRGSLSPACFPRSQTAHDRLSLPGCRSYRTQFYPIDSWENWDSVHAPKALVLNPDCTGGSLGEPLTFPKALPHPDALRDPGVTFVFFFFFRQLIPVCSRGWLPLLLVINLSASEPPGGLAPPQGVSFPTSGVKPEDFHF